MKHLVLAAAAILAVGQPAAAASFRSGSLEVGEPWSRPAAAGTTGVGYMTLINHGAGPAVLTGVESPLAARVEIHRSRIADGVMRMEPQSQVPVPPGGRVVFGPGGLHLMLIGLKAPLAAGDRAPATLTFSNGVKLKVVFAVGAGLGPPSVNHSHP